MKSIKSAFGIKYPIKSEDRKTMFHCLELIVFRDYSVPWLPSFPRLLLELSFIEFCVFCITTDELLSFMRVIL